MEVEGRRKVARPGGGQGVGTYCLMSAEFRFYQMGVVPVVQQHDCHLTALNCPLKNGYDENNLLLKIVII